MPNKTMREYQQQQAERANRGDRKPSRPRAVPEAQAIAGPDLDGIIKNTVLEKGFGFIKVDGGSEYFFHRSCVANVDFQDLEPGDHVRFSPMTSPKGLRAHNVNLL